MNAIIKLGVEVERTEDKISSHESISCYAAFVFFLILQSYLN